MTKKIGIIDYGLSNLLSIYRAMEYVGAETAVVSEASEFSRYDKLVLPGVGAFPDGMNMLHERGMAEPLKKHAADKKPFFGICLGMQMMLGMGYEITETPGLDLIPGKVLPLPSYDDQGNVNRIPHVGWEFIREPQPDSWKTGPLHREHAHNPYYFVHSFYVVPDNPDHIWAEADFGNMKFAAAVRREMVFGTQFHPEKSGEQGLELLRQFVLL
jgi:glutamine amidotransferase